MTVPEDFLCLSKPVDSTSSVSILVQRTSSGPDGTGALYNTHPPPLLCYPRMPRPYWHSRQQQLAAPAAYPQVVKDVADEGDVADPGLE